MSKNCEGVGSKDNSSLKNLLPEVPTKTPIPIADPSRKKSSLIGLSVEVKIAGTDFFKDFLNIYKGVIEDNRVPLEVKNEAKEKLDKLIEKFKPSK